MKLFEYQGKELLRAAGVPVPRGDVVTRVEDVAGAVARLGGGPVVVKAQVLVGGRGKAGGVKVVRNAGEAEDLARRLLGAPLVTHQGRETVSALLLEETAAIARELYVAFLVDRDRGRAVLLAAGRGGVDIEELAKTDPGAIATIPFDPGAALPPAAIERAAAALSLAASEDLASFLGAAAQTFAQRDLLLLEINPLVVTPAGGLLALDAKLIVDDNALFKHPDLPAGASESPVEAEARAAGLSWVDLGGDIACLVNGAGLAMATADAIKFAGGSPANFLDIGGGADRARLETAFRLLLGGRAVRSVLVNVFGGIVRCDLVAQALVDALAAVPQTPPIVVRLEGTNIEEARRIIAAAGGPFTMGESLDAAARLAVEVARGGK